LGFSCALASLVSILFVSAVFCFGTLKTYCCPVGWVCNGFNGDTVKGDPEHPGPWYCEPFLEEDYDTFLIPGLIIVCLVFPALYCIYKIGTSRGGPWYNVKKPAPKIKKIDVSKVKKGAKVAPEPGPAT